MCFPDSKLPYKLILLVGICLSALGVNAQWKQDHFIVGTFYDPQVPNCKLTDTAAYIQKMQMVKDAGFNLVSGLDACYDYNWVNFKLGLFSKIGLQTLMIDLNSSRKKNIAFSASKGTDWLDFTKKLDPAKRNALYGYMVYDEPLMSGKDAVRQWVGYMKKGDSKKLAYLNLLPIFVFKSRDEYGKYLDTFLLGNNMSQRPDIVSYDFYPFTNDGLTADYFYNLYIAKQKAEGRPMWCYALTTKHNKYTEVDPYQLNFMVFAPVMYGFKGILYFTYQTIVGSSVPFGPAVVDADFKPTSKYYQIQKINNFLTGLWGPIVFNSSNVGVYHASSQPYNNQSIEQEELLSSSTPLVADLGNDNLAVGIYKSLNSPGEYNLFVFNKAQTAIKNVGISLKGNYKNSVTLSVPYSSYTSTKAAFMPAKAIYDQNSAQTKVQVSFQPGEGRVLKLTGVKENL
jgi:hypothetical protein